MTALWRIAGAAGLVAFRIDMFAARVLPGRLGRFAARRPIGVTILLLAMVAVLLRTVIAATPFFGATTFDLHDLSNLSGEDRRVTITGVLADEYLVSFWDENEDQVQQPEEDARAWVYFLGHPDGSVGIRVHSQRPPEDVFRSGGGTASFTGRLQADLGFAVEYDPDVPGFDPKTLPFPISPKGWFYDGSPFGQVAVLGEAALVFGAFALFLIVGVVTGYLPFRSAGSDVRLTTSAGPTGPVPVWVSGLIRVGQTVARIRDAPATATLAIDANGRAVLSIRLLRW